MPIYSIQRDHLYTILNSGLPVRAPVKDEHAGPPMCTHKMSC